MKISVSSHDELLAAVPHMFGFTPHESLVLYPFAPGLPRVRVDLPTSQTARDDVWESLEVPFGRHARPGAVVAIICLTTDRSNAERASEDLRSRLESIDVTTPLRLWADDTQWCDLDSHESGQRTQAARTRIDAQMVAAGHALPIASRSAMAASLLGDRDPIARLMPAARTASAASDPPAEHAWAMERLHRFHADGNALNDLDAARMLLAVSSVPVRDDVWENISARTTQSHVALWTNLTRRAPDDVRAAPATLLSFASWIGGDGAKAWCALDQVPSAQEYPMARLMSAALTAGVNPSEWEVQAARLHDINELARDLARTLQTPQGPLNRPAREM